MRNGDIADVLRERGHRVTRARLAVWQALASSSGHATVDDLAARAQAIEPGVNLASVYRSLALFAELDLARESRLGDSDATRWEVAHPDEQFHLVCERCGNVEHHVGELVQRISDHLEQGHGFAPRTVELTVTGICRWCRERAAG
jgi:Fe2+ or Zn2+ uptake regulation protein